MKNNVIGSRQTMMNSLNKIAPRPRKGRDFIAKFQVPNPKSQGNSNFQPPKGRATDWILEFGASLGFGAWGLMLCCSCRFLFFARVFGAQRNKNVLERRPDLVDVGLADADAAQFFVNVGAAHA